MWSLIVACACATEPPRLSRDPEDPPDPPPADPASFPTPAATEEPPVETPPPDASTRRNPLSWTDLVAVRSSRRATAEEFLVLPSGIDVGGRLRTITADGGLGPGRIRLTDAALLDLTVDWAFAKHFELDASVTLLPKQPDMTRERFVQGASLSIRRDVVWRTAVAVSAFAAPLIDLPGHAFGGSALVVHKHRLDSIVTFELTAGVLGTRLPHAQLVEATAHAAVLAREPEGIWGGWIGAGYAVPIEHRGDDPATAMPLAPKPRLDLDIGNAVRLGDHWDLSAELAIIDRGDLADPATRLPVLDGGFDQIQIIVGVSRRFSSGHRDATRD